MIGQYCCELLSKISIFDIRNNTGLLTGASLHVVNCSQKLVSLTSETTECTIASDVNRCELLSKISIFDIRNNAFV